MSDSTGFRAAAVAGLVLALMLGCSGSAEAQGWTAQQAQVASDRDLAMTWLNECHAITGLGGKLPPSCAGAESATTVEQAECALLKLHPESAAFHWRPKSCD